ncbi:hypothetical protein [Bosea sp. PAMC 26642]|nr:hypothetical protein [Bosea sp. PAMC 26642]
MKRIVIILGLLGLATSLSACDKCGDSVKFFQGPSTSCGDTKPAS